MPNFGIFNEKDADNRWFRFDHQQMGNSCTMASAKIAKEYYTNTTIGEAALRGLATLYRANATNRGISALDDRVTDALNWETTPGYAALTLKVLKAQPGPIRTANRVSSSMKLLRKATRNHPVLIGWSWTTGAGHCTVCVGPLKADPDLLVILDPAFGLQYVNVQETVGNMFTYTPINKATGNIAKTGKHRPGNTFITT